MSPFLVPPATIADDENLARFVFRPRDVRVDSTLKPDVFIPYPHPDLSLTRHFGLQDREIWEMGETVAFQRSLPLIGRGDIVTAEFRRHQLTVSAAPVPGNAHHANITGWPPDKPAQKILAQEISAVAQFIATPNAPESRRGAGE
jgi:hypothetical protein